MTNPLQDFSRRNRVRCEAPNGFNHALASWSLYDWLTATIGELGEAANVVKKLNRVRDGIPGNKHTPEQLREMLAGELADTLIYLDLMAQSEGIELSLSMLTAPMEGDASRYIAMIGRSIGIACDVAIETRREKLYLRGAFQSAVIYLNLTACAFGIDLAAATLATFAKKSAEIGYVE